MIRRYRGRLVPQRPLIEVDPDTGMRARRRSREISLRPWATRASLSSRQIRLNSDGSTSAWPAQRRPRQSARLPLPLPHVTNLLPGPQHRSECLRPRHRREAAAGSAQCWASKSSDSPAAPDSPRAARSTRDSRCAQSQTAPRRDSSVLKQISRAPWADGFSTRSANSSMNRAARARPKSIALGEGEDLLELIEYQQRNERGAGGIPQHIVPVM